MRLADEIARRFENVICPRSESIEKSGASPFTMGAPPAGTPRLSLRAAGPVSAPPPRDDRDARVAVAIRERVRALPPVDAEELETVVLTAGTRRRGGAVEPGRAPPH